MGAAAMSVVVDRVERRLPIFASTVMWLAGMVLIGRFAASAMVVVATFLGALALGSYLQVAYTFTPEISRDRRND